MFPKKFIKKAVPKKVLNLRHLFYAWLGSVVYGRPSEELLVIGVTGTSGKSSTIYLLRRLLESIGFQVGALSTIEFCVAGECELNDKKMTMLGKMSIQKYLRKMVRRGCDIAIIETTSEGAVQYRHKCINYDMIMLTNLYPEHIESHGSFENYKAAKLSIFKHVSKCKRKNLEFTKNLQEHQTQKEGRIPKTCIVNGGNKYAKEFLNFDFDQKLTFGKNSEFSPMDTKVNEMGLQFSLGNKQFNVKMYGEFNIMNIIATVRVARAWLIDWNLITKAVSDFSSVPGRIEFIPEAAKRGFKVIVDYAFEPVAIAELYKVVELLKPRKIIHVFGSTGGGRDKERRSTVGMLVGKKADICIITDEDPYYDDPMKIIEEVASAVEGTGKEENKNLFKILNRSEAIKKAIDIAQAGDLVLVTGKGSEQAMAVKGKLLPWDDREEVRKALNSKT